jgi:hypothetical protein
MSCHDRVIFILCNTGSSFLRRIHNLKTELIRHANEAVIAYFMRDLLAIIKLSYRK